jgi:Domain of unknown function (DUF4936)
VKQAYVYYRIDARLAEHAGLQINTLQNLMASHCSEPPRHLIRCDDSAMWMEVYERIIDFSAFTAALAAAVGSLDCAAFTLGERHLECFTSKDPMRNLADSSLSPT